MNTHYKKKQNQRLKKGFSSLQVAELATKMELVAKSEDFCRLKQFSSQMYGYWRLKINLVADYMGFSN